LLDAVRLVSREIYEERIQRLAPIADDVLYSREGERFGLAALVPPGIDLCLGQRMMMLRINAGFAAAYVMWVLNGDSVYQQVVSGITGATAPHVNISEVINFHLPVPPKSEQVSIAAEIERVTTSLDDLISESEAAITLLQERRSALISAAVTGKIDVRGIAPAEAKAA
jgi:type I restriction enzyme S subunit